MTGGRHRRQGLACFQSSASFFSFSTLTSFAFRMASYSEG